MVHTLAEPAVVRSYGDDSFTPSLPVLVLRWDAEELGEPDRVWKLPEAAQMVGPPPVRFGIRVEHWGHNSYSADLLWNSTCFSWPCVTRRQLLESDLESLLQAVGMDLLQLLDQPIRQESAEPNKAA